MIGGTSLPKRERARVGVTTRRATRSSAAKDAEAQQEAEDISQQAEQPHPGQWARILPTEDASQFRKEALELLGYPPHEATPSILDTQVHSPEIVMTNSTEEPPHVKPETPKKGTRSSVKNKPKHAKREMKKARKTSAKRSQRGHPAVVPKHQLAPPGPEAADDNQGSKTASRHPLIYEGFVSQELAAREAQRPPPAGAETSPLVVQAFPAPHAQNCGPRLVGNDAPDVSLSTGEGLPDASTVQPPQELQQKSYGALRSPGQLKCPPKSITPKHIMSMCRMNLQELEQDSIPSAAAANPPYLESSETSAFNQQKVNSASVSLAILEPRTRSPDTVCDDNSVSLDDSIQPHWTDPDSLFYDQIRLPREVIPPVQPVDGNLPSLEYSVPASQDFDGDVFDTVEPFVGNEDLAPNSSNGTNASTSPMPTGHIQGVLGSLSTRSYPGNQPSKWAAIPPLYELHPPTLTVGKFVKALGDLHEHGRRMSGHNSDFPGYREPPPKLLAGGHIQQAGYAEKQQQSAAQRFAPGSLEAEAAVATGAWIYMSDISAWAYQMEAPYGPDFGMNFIDWAQWDADRMGPAL